jgi:hypothetical protein
MGLFGVPNLAVFVFDKRKKPLMPCSEKRARLPLTLGRAGMHRRHPITIRLKDRVGADVQPIGVKIDPGSKTTGVVVITEEDGNKPAKVLGLFEPAHVGRTVVRAEGSCSVGRADGINAQCCKHRHRADRYGYAWRAALPPPAEARGLQRGRLG